MRKPGILHADHLIGNNQGWSSAGFPDGTYAASRPLPFYTIGMRWRAAWLVFTGRADALLWKNQ